MKRKIFLLLALMLTSISTWAKTDVTDTYLANAAVADATGWTNGATANDANWTGRPDDVCLNHGWWSGTSNMYQTVTLPKGTYLLTAMTRGDANVNSNIYALDVAADKNLASASVTKRGNSGYNNGWGETAILFTLTEAKSVQIGWWCGGTNTEFANADYFKLYTIEAGDDVTSIIVNPSFETGDKTGWTDDSSTDDKFYVQGNKSFSLVDGNYYAERYWWDNTSDINQTTPTLPAGIYRITAAAQDDAASPTFTLYAKAGSSDEVTKIVGAADDYSVEVSLASSGTIKMGFKGAHTHAQWVAVDNFRMAYLGGATIDGTIPSSGYGSLACAYGLDFANATVSSGSLTAYAVTSTTASTITMTSVDEQPANSGVILKGIPNATYSIPVKLDAAYGGTNLLSAAVTATDIAANEAYILQSGQFHLVTAASTVPAGKAYLLATHVPSGARDLIFNFEEDSPTAIDAIEAADVKSEGLKDGKYLVKGKIVLVKNGLKFNANGQILK